MQCLLSILSLFGNELNKFNNTGARVLDYIYHMTLKLFCNRIFGVKTSRFCQLVHNVRMDGITLHYLICSLSILLHDVISLSCVTSCD